MFFKKSKTASELYRIDSYWSLNSVATLFGAMVSKINNCIHVFQELYLVIPHCNTSNSKFVHCDHRAHMYLFNGQAR